MEHYSQNLIELGTGQPAAEYVAGITEDLVNADWNSPDSKLKKLLPIEAKEDRNFMVKAAAILGYLASEKDSMFRFNQWIRVSYKMKTFSKKPENIGEPVLLSSDYKGVKLWLMKSYTTRMPSLV
jgi:hypothetical protein